ncbi:MAG TPA: DMT family transporter [Acidisarcina sp.]
MSRSLRAHLLLLSVALLWGVTFVLVKDVLADISPLLFNLLRMAIAFLCMAVVYRRHFAKVNARALWCGAAVGLFLAAGYQFQTAGLARTTPSKSAFITGLVVVLVPLLAAISWLRSPQARPPRWNAWVAALLAFTGILLLTMPRSAASASIIPALNLHGINRGDLLTMGCALAFALHCIALSRTSESVSFEQIALLQIGFATLFMAMTMPMFEHPWIHLSTRLVLALAVTGVLGTAAAFSIQSWAQQFLPATHTVLILSLEPVFAAISSFILLGERLGVRGGLGAIFVLAGIALTELTPAGTTPTAHEGMPG